ncbi:hypothetical protein M378DRAFT_155592 [Amanita muscaria Koide BX008]|uniref:protein-tyrosine-phosphatase n=1 Tax=Amanita muscaria (strain Koide BX008) TaxID=946122 RepID=A0A0C2X8G5_AMAMK|nr:hypothetical protein M378DRAFT_155592 [Amanita muscaria Koide BX008]
MPRRKPPSGLTINPQLSQAHDPTRNMKKLSISIPSAQSSTNSLHVPSEPQSAVVPDHQPLFKHRRSSVVSLPVTVAPTVNSMIRRDEESSPTIPYADGPVQVIPKVWLGSEDNAQDWKGLVDRGITSILNVAKEVTLPFDLPHPSVASASSVDPTYYPPHAFSERPGMHYLKLSWSHGQQNLVNDGFRHAMSFVDAALERGDGVLIHCQCGISRSATLVIALVMRAAAERASNVPTEVWSLKGMHGAYSYVKEKSKWISPNMSLLYQLLEYQKKLKIDSGSPNSSDHSSSSPVDEEEEWGRQRRLLDEMPSDDEQNRENNIMMHEAQALDKAMEDRLVARKSSSSSLCSSSSGFGMGPAWRSRYGSRKRTGSIASTRTTGSILSEDLVEEDEEAELLGIGGGFDSEKTTEEYSSSVTSPDEEMDTERISTRAFHVPPTASAMKTSFNLQRPIFNLPRSRAKRRPPPILPPVPPSPVTIDSSEVLTATATSPCPRLSVSTPVQRVVVPPTPSAESCKGIPSPLHVQHSALRKTRSSQDALKAPFAPASAPQVNTPSQTLFVFPSSPTAIRTAATLTVTSTPSAVSTRFSSTSTPRPRVSSFRQNGRPRSFIGIGTPATPTTGFTKLNVRGYVGIHG